MVEETSQSYASLAQMARAQARASRTPGACEALIELACDYERKAALLAALEPPKPYRVPDKSS